MISELKQLSAPASGGVSALLALSAVLLVGGCGTSNKVPVAETDATAAPALPQPTERLFDQTEGEEWKQQREAWLESLHRAAPGTDWRTLERRNWNAHLERRNRLRDDATTSSAGVVDGWSEIGSDNQAGPYRYDNDTGVWAGVLDLTAPMTTYWDVESLTSVRCFPTGRAIPTAPMATVRSPCPTTSRVPPSSITPGSSSSTVSSPAMSPCGSGQLEDVDRDRFSRLWDTLKS